MQTYHVKPEIEIFDLAMLYNAVNLVERGLIASPAHVQFVMGVPMPCQSNVRSWSF
jgi:uncharacterized protein (DUF849 family)